MLKFSNRARPRTGPAGKWQKGLTRVAFPPGAGGPGLGAAARAPPALGQLAIVQGAVEKRHFVLTVAPRVCLHMRVHDRTAQVLKECRSHALLRAATRPTRWRRLGGLRSFRAGSGTAGPAAPPPLFARPLRSHGRCLPALRRLLNQQLQALLVAFSPLERDSSIGPGAALALERPSSPLAWALPVPWSGTVPLALARPRP